MTETYSRQLEKIKAAMAIDPLFFAKRVAPVVFKHPFGSFHRCLVHDILHPQKQITEIMVTRGHGKSTISTVLMPIWLAIHKGWQYIVITSKTDTVAKQFIAHIQNIVESERFKSYYGDLRGRGEKDVWNQNNVTLRGPGLHARIECRGAGMQFAGLLATLVDKSGELAAIRPQLVVIDDTEDDETVLNAEQVDKMENWLTGTVKPGLHDEHSRIFLIGTTYKADCLLTRIEAYPKGVNVIKYPLVVNSKKLSKKLGLPIDTPIWHENPKFSREEVNKLREEYYENGKIRQFLLQYMLDSRAGSVYRFSKEDVDRARFKFEDIAEKNLNWFMTVDFAYTTRKHSDSSAIVLCAWDERKHVYVVEARQGKWGDVETAKQMAEIAVNYQPYINATLPVYIETMALTAVNSVVEKELNDAGIPHFCGQLKPMNRPKENRIKPLVPLSQAGRLHLRSDTEPKELEKQMWKFHGLAAEKDDDLLDALAYQLDIGFPTSVKRETGIGSEANKLAWEKHLRRLERGGENRPHRIGPSILGSVDRSCNFNRNFWSTAFLYKQNRHEYDEVEERV